MRSVFIWILSSLLVGGALSATASMMTLKWLYPQKIKEALPNPVGGPILSRTFSGMEEQLAIEAVRGQKGDLQPSPIHAAPLPAAPGGPVRLLVWAQYQRNGQPARGAYQVTIAGKEAVSLIGPIAPYNGYAAFPFEPLDERARKLSPPAYRGRPFVLVAPRAPEPGLAELMGRLHAIYSPQGIDTVLALDIRSPDWSATARLAGFKGPVWRLKAELEDIPVVNQGLLLGAVGLLIDRQGEVVASLAALDPARYGLFDQPVDAIAAQVFRAYGLLP